MNIDPELIRACIDRERRAEYEMYKQTYSYLMSICVRYASQEDEAKEALNIGFLKIFRNLKNYRPEVPFKKWIRKIMINSLIDEYRKKKKHQELIQYVEEYPQTSNDDEIQESLLKIEARQIHMLINKLPETGKQVFNLYVVDEYSHKEISAMLGFTEGTSKWYLSVAKQKLKEMINELAPPVKTA